MGLPGKAEGNEFGGVIERDVYVLTKKRDGEEYVGPAAMAGRPKLLITPIFHEFFRFFPVFPWTFGRAPWIPGVQTLKMGERWGKMGKKWVKNEITGLQKTALMHASAGLESPRLPDSGSTKLI